MFERVVEACTRGRTGGGEGLAVDASLIQERVPKATLDRRSGLAQGSWIRPVSSAGGRMICATSTYGSGAPPARSSQSSHFAIRSRGPVRTRRSQGTGIYSLFRQISHREKGSFGVIVERRGLQLHSAGRSRAAKTDRANRGALGLSMRACRRYRLTGQLRCLNWRAREERHLRQYPVFDKSKRGRWHRLA